MRSEVANDPSLGTTWPTPPPPARAQDGGLASSPRSQDGRRLTTSPRGERAVGRGLAAACRAVPCRVRAGREHGGAGRSWRRPGLTPSGGTGAARSRQRGPGPLGGKRAAGGGRGIAGALRGFAGPGSRQGAVVRGEPASLLPSFPPGSRSGAGDEAARWWAALNKASQLAALCC